MTPREEMLKAIEQHARLTALVAESIARKIALPVDQILEALHVEARQTVMRRKQRNGFQAPSDDGEPRPPP